MIGFLLHLIASRSNIIFSVCLCFRSQSCPKKSHLSVIKQILIYLKGTIDLSLCYPKYDNFDLIVFSNANFSDCKMDKKNTSDTYHFLGCSLVSWHSKKQISIALSMAKAKYITINLCYAQILWMKQTLSVFGLFFIYANKT